MLFRSIAGNDPLCLPLGCFWKQAVGRKDGHGKTAWRGAADVATVRRPGEIMNPPGGVQGFDGPLTNRVGG